MPLCVSVYVNCVAQIVKYAHGIYLLQYKMHNKENHTYADEEYHGCLWCSFSGCHVIDSCRLKSWHRNTFRIIIPWFVNSPSTFDGLFCATWTGFWTATDVLVKWNDQTYCGLMICGAIEYSRHYVGWWPVTCSSLSHYLNPCWLSVRCTDRNKF